MIDGDVFNINFLWGLVGWFFPVMCLYLESGFAGVGELPYFLILTF